MGRKQQGSSKNRRRPPSDDENYRYRKHKLFGNIRLVPDPENPGSWRYDPRYEPELPRGAVRGSIGRQDYCPMCHVPNYFYVDIARDCVQCDKRFTFSAKEQKHWYETLGFWLDSTAVRCLDCRREERTKKSLNTELGVILAKVSDQPENPTHLTSLAEITALFYEAHESGDLDRGVAAARKAQALWPEGVIAAFWEGRCQLLSDRRVQARTCFERFLDAASINARTKPMIAYAEAFVKRPAD